MHEPIWPPSIEAINDLPEAEKQAIYLELVPDWVYDRYGVARDTLSVAGQRVVHIRCPAGARGMELTVYHQPGAVDPLLYLNMADNNQNQLLVLLLVVNDPDSPRFDTDRLPDGTPTKLGTVARNLAEEIRAMEYGLAPGQIRSGLRVFRNGVARFEAFVARMGHQMFFIEPLAYHNAISFERYGFSYTYGRRAMEQLHAEFQPGGELHARLDGSTPFRHTQAAQSVRGRSWAIHDGLMGKRFDGFQMYKRLHIEAGIQTFPGSVW
jgi:hypothetical protein